MKKNSSKIGILISILILACSIAVTFLHVQSGYNTTESSILSDTIKQITYFNRFHQIIATMVMWVVGFLVTYPLCADMNIIWCYLLAMPVGNAVWGISSALILFVNIPYNRFTMVVVFVFIMAGLMYKFKDEYKKLKLGTLIEALIVVLAITIMASSGVFAIYTSSDSYYFVMQYGELIARWRQLSSDIVGAFMTWTGIMPALTSSFAAMWGFENIYAIHYLLVFSMYGFIMATVYKNALKYYGKIISFSIMILALITVGVIPGVSYLTTWVISNTYLMVYIVLLMLLPVIERDNLNPRKLVLMSLFIIWITLCRSETAVTMCFCIICISSLKLEKMQVLFLYVPMCIYQLLFLANIVYQSVSGARQASSKLLTPETVAVILLALVLTGGYIGLYNLKFISFIREHMMAFVLAVLCIACLVLGVLDSEKIINNINVFSQNLKSWYWKYVPVTILILEILKSCYKCRNRYYDLIVWGFILCNFVICMGRSQYLRYGIGDSYNRICMSILPLYVVSTILTFVEYLGEERGRKKLCKK